MSLDFGDTLCRWRPPALVCVVSGALAGLVLAVPAAAVPPRLHTGSTRYVRLVHLRDGGLSIALTARGRKRFRRVLRGFVLDATCTTLGKTVQGSTQGTQSSGAEGSSGPGGRFNYHVLLDRYADFCDVGRARQRMTHNGESTTHVPGPTLDSIALSQKGAAYLDEERVTERMFGILETAIEDAYTDPEGRFPPAEKLAAMFPGRVVALASADASPPAGVVGFYSDDANHAEAVALSALDRRLFIDSNDGVLSTNPADDLFRAMSGEVATLSGY